MTTIAGALRKILAAVSPLAAERVSLSRAAGRVLARDWRAKMDLPSFDNSTMDGYAVRAADLRGAGPGRPVELAVQGLARAGRRGPEKIKAGHAVKIMTGAPLPRRADAVVMQELSASGGPGKVKIFHAPKRGQWIRPRGGDIGAGALLMKAGRALRPYEVSALAAQGAAQVAVFRKPRVAVLSTGDELLGPGRPLSRGKIYDSNGPAILSALPGWGVDAVDFGIAGDEPRKIKARLKSALSRCDAVLVSGGVSVGDFDYTKSMLESLGVKTVFWKVKIKPGKPLFFGVYKGKKPVFGLPGNPVSVLVCLEEFVRPALDKLQGAAPQISRYHLRGKAVNGFVLPKERQQRLFCEATQSGPGFSLRIVPRQASHMAAACSKANALAAPAQGVSRVKPGDILAFRWLN